MTAAAAHRYRRGLVVGKFSPLHLGHERVIAQAQAQCDEVMVLGYSRPGFPGCGPARREDWVRTRFPAVRNLQIDADWVQRRCAERGTAHRPMPANDAADAAHQQWLIWLLDAVLQWRPDAMFGSEAYLHPTTARMGHAWGHTVSPVTVDLTRIAVPISARRIRANVHAHRQWLAPTVYRDFVPRVALLGAESTGKTTLAQALAQDWQTLWVPEYGRERWESCGGQLTLDDLVDIGHTQVAREEALHLRATRALFCDTSPLTTLGYAGWMFGAQPAPLLQLAQRRYDLVVLCEPDFPFVQDGTRRDEGFQHRQQQWYAAQLACSGQPWMRAQGSLQARIGQVQAALRGR